MKSIFLGSLAFIVWCTFSVYHYTCNIVNLCNTPIVAYNVPFQISDNAGFEINSEYNLQYELGNSTWSNSFDSLPVNQLKRYLDKNKTLNIEIVGKAFETEEDNKLLAKQRALKIREQLINKNIKSNRIVINQAISATPKDEYDLYSGLSEFNFVIDSSQIVQLKNKSIKLYFEFGKNEIVMTDSLQQYFKQVKLYLGKNKGKRALLTGHTDNIGDENQNNLLGLERAKVMKDVLVKLGISNEQINTFSQGELKPLADNSTEENRKLNRRVEIIIN